MGVVGPPPAPPPLVVTKPLLLLVAGPLLAAPPVLLVEPLLVVVAPFEPLLLAWLVAPAVPPLVPVPPPQLHAAQSARNAPTMPVTRVHLAPRTAASGA